MAILTEPNYPRGIIFGDVVRPHQSIYEQSATQTHKLGTKLEYGDGRKFRYSKNGAVALVQALMTQTAVEESKAVAIVQTGHAQIVGAEDLTVLVTTASASPENAFAEGMMTCNKVSPAVLGDVYKIVASKLQSTDTLLDIKIEYPGIRNAIGATGEVSLSYNRWYNTVVHPVTTATAPAAGVPLIPVTANYYYWAQTGGPAPLMVDTGDTIVIGGSVGVAGTSAVAGACGTRVTTKYEWGVVMSIAAADETALVYLTID